MSRQDIGDELLTLLAAGHETTASTLGWVFERIARHPEVMSKMVEEAATDDNEYRQATILEVQHDPHRPRLRRPAGLLADIRARRMGYPARVFDRGKHLGDALPLPGVPRPGAVRSAAL